MEKRVWTTPKAVVEQFMPNEYIAACWGVACDTDAANQIEDRLNNRPTGGHRRGECGDFEQQAIITDANNNPIKMVEVGTYWGDLDCTIYTDATFTVQKDITEVKAGEAIYWVTSYGNNVYHHVGTVRLTDAYRVNHS